MVRYLEYNWIFSKVTYKSSKSEHSICLQNKNENSHYTIIYGFVEKTRFGLYRCYRSNNSVSYALAGSLLIILYSWNAIPLFCTELLRYYVSSLINEYNNNKKNFF